MTSVSIRRGTAADLGTFQRALYEALDWNPDEHLPEIDVVLAHPEAVRYHTEWGRTGDIGVVAEFDGAPVGAAYARLFTPDDHGHGYVDEETPEVAIAVWSGHRGQGVGGLLLEALENEAQGAGISRLSLSVDIENPASRLYLRHGYEVISDERGSYLMLKSLV